LRAWFATRMPYIDATRSAVSVGKSFAIAMGIFGLLVINPILIAIAIFIYFGASEEEKATVISVTLEGVKVRDVMKREIISIGPDADAFDALKLMSSRNLGRLIVMEDGQMVGIVSRTDLMRAIQFRGAYK